MLLHGTRYNGSFSFNLYLLTEQLNVCKVLNIEVRIQNILQQMSFFVLLAKLFKDIILNVLLLNVRYFFNILKLQNLFLIHSRYKNIWSAWFANHSTRVAAYGLFAIKIQIFIKFWPDAYSHSFKIRLFSLCLSLW